MMLSDEGEVLQHILPIWLMPLTYSTLPALLHIRNKPQQSVTKQACWHLQLVPHSNDQTTHDKLFVRAC